DRAPCPCSRYRMCRSPVDTSDSTDCIWQCFPVQFRSDHLSIPSCAESTERRYAFDWRVSSLIQTLDFGISHPACDGANDLLHVPAICEFPAEMQNRPRLTIKPEVGIALNALQLVERNGLADSCREELIQRVDGVRIHIAEPAIQHVV